MIYRCSMKNLKKYIMLMMALTYIKYPAQAEIMSIKTIKEVDNIIENLLKNQKPENILLAFDVDMTLIQPDHPAVYYPAIKKYMDVYKLILGHLTPAQKDLVATLTTQIVPQKLVEKDAPKIIKNIQNKDVKVIAITSSLAGKVENFRNKMIFIRRDQLQKMTFQHFKEYASGYPMFYHGILSTNGEGDVSKGSLLTALLSHVGPHYACKVQKSGYYPKVLILVDDNKQQLESIEALLKACNPLIQFIGIEYGVGVTYAPRDISKEDFQKFWENLANRTKRVKFQARWYH